VAGTDSALFFFVNLHPQDLTDDELYAADSPLSYVATRIVLEVTERASLVEIDDLAGRLQRLRALGYRIALDDLGAGYAGLNSFLELRPELVKLDMALIRDLDRDETKRKLVSKLISLCSEMGCQIIAEGVERQGEREALTAMGCELLQGYHFCKPLRSLGQLDWTRDDLAVARAPVERETARLASLRSYDILDSAPEAAFDAITHAAKEVAGTAVAFVGFLDEGRQWYKSQIGLDVAETPREQTICRYVVADEAAIVVADLRADARFRDHPAVQRADGPRFYAGFPLRAADGQVLGTLGVLDGSPRQLSRPARHALAALAHQCVFELELRRRLAQGSEVQPAPFVAQSSTSEALRTLVSSLSRMMASAEALAQDDLADAPERGREMTATMQTMRNFIGEQLARVLTSAG
jgi:GAF domain-containing protein